MRQSMMQNQALIPDDEVMIYERPALTNFKLGVLIFLTFGLIVAIYAMSNAIQQVNGPIANGYMAGGGIIFGLFCVYVIIFCTLWFFGAGKREQLKRDVVEKAIAKERALQAKQNLE